MGEWGKPGLGLSCRITADRREYAIAADVYVLVEVKKTTDRAIALGRAREVKQRNGRTARQLGELRTVAMRGRPGYFPTVQTVFPNEDEPRSQIRVLEPGATYSETLVRSPWKINIGSLPSTPELREMQLQVSLFQFIAPGVETSQVESNRAVFTVAPKPE